MPSSDDLASRKKNGKFCISQEHISDHIIPTYKKILKSKQKVKCRDEEGLATKSVIRMEKSWKVRSSHFSILLLTVIIISSVLTISGGWSLIFSPSNSRKSTNSSHESMSSLPLQHSRNFPQNNIKEQEDSEMMKDTQKEVTSILPSNKAFKPKKDPKVAAAVVPDYIINYSETFTWIDESADNFNTTVIEGSKQIREVIMPFAFPFYDQLFSTVYVTSLGWLTFNSYTILTYLINGMGIFRNFNTGSFLPNTNAEYMIAPLISEFFNTDSLNESELQVILGIDNQKLVITYKIEKPSIDIENTVFQVVLMSNGTILFNYQHLGDIFSNSIFTTDIGLNYGNGFIYSSVPLSAVIDKQNVTIRFERINPERDLAVSIGFSDLYYYELNKSVPMSIHVANIGKLNMTNFTAMLFMDDVMVWNVTFNGINGEYLSSTQVISNEIFLNGTNKIFGVNMTLIVMQLDNVTHVTRLQDNQTDNNRLEIRLQFANPLDRYIPVTTRIANNLEPLSGAQVKIEEIHGLITLEGTTGTDGTVNITGWMIKDFIPVVIEVTASHPEWGSDSALYLIELLSDFSSRRDITLYLGPGRVTMTTPCSTQGTPLDLGFCPFTITVIPQKKIYDVQKITVKVNDYKLSFLPHYDLIFGDNETVAETMMYVPIFRTETNNITIYVSWNDGHTSILDTVIVNGSNIRPLLKMNVGTFFQYEWIILDSIDYIMNFTVMEKIDADTVKIGYSFGSASNANYPPSGVFQQGTMLVNIYNGLINDTSGYWENPLYFPFKNDVKRFFFMFPFEDLSDNVTGLLIPLYSWNIIYAVTGTITNNEPDDTWLLNSRLSFGFGYAWYSKNTSVLTYLDSAYLELTLLNYNASVSNSTVPSSENTVISNSKTSSLFDLRIPSFTSMITALTILTSIAMKRTYRLRKKNHDGGK